MDISEILKRRDECRAAWHTIKGAEFKVRLPSRREMVLLVADVNTKKPSMADMFSMVDRCLAFVEDWRGVVDAEQAEIEFDADTLAVITDDDVELGQALVDLVMTGYRVHEDRVAEEKKH